MMEAEKEQYNIKISRKVQKLDGEAMGGNKMRADRP